MTTHDEFREHMLSIFGTARAMSLACTIPQPVVSQIFSGVKTVSLNYAIIIRAACAAYGQPIRWLSLPLSQHAVSQLIGLGVLELREREEPPLDNPTTD